jgi:hypothetical protein
MIQKAMEVAIKEGVKEATEGLRREIQEVRKEVQAKGAPASARARTWAAVAAGEPTKMIPSRLSKEILVRGSTAPALIRRSPQEIVQAVNGASEKKGAVAARKLPSGDIIVTFQDTKTKEWHTEKKEWIKKAFGEAAREAKRTYAVLLKGMLKKDLKDTTEAEFGRAVGLSSVDKVKFRIPTLEGITRATALVTLTSQEEAKKACEEGVVWQAQMLNCEPYWAVLQATQCYRCWGWGHTQRFCRKRALCPRCGSTAHGEGGRVGEAQCPTHGNKIPLRCASCAGKHPAWVRWCPEAVKARGAAREAYYFRPRTFELALEKQQQQAQQNQLPKMRHVTFRGTPEEEEFQEVGRKRLRGRPPAMAVAQERAAKDLRQGKLNLVARVSTVQATAAEAAPASQATAARAAAASSVTDPDVGMQGL